MKDTFMIPMTHSGAVTHSLTHTHLQSHTHMEVLGLWHYEHILAGCSLLCRRNIMWYVGKTH